MTTLRLQLAFALSASLGAPSAGYADELVLLRTWNPCYTIGGLNSCSQTPLYYHSTTTLDGHTIEELGLYPGHPTGGGVRIIGVGLFVPGASDATGLSPFGYYPKEWDTADRGFWLLGGPFVPNYLTYWDPEVWVVSLSLPLNLPYDNPELTYIWRGYHESEHIIFDCWQSTRDPDDTQCVTVTPEPTTLTLLFLGLAGIVMAVRVRSHRLVRTNSDR